jgi:peptide/nickel transport system substrate-binding protein
VHSGQSFPTETLTRLTQGTLVRLNRANGDIEPWLASGWTVSADGRTYTVKLRDGVSFSDGVPFTSADVVFSFQALYDPQVRSDLASGVEVQGKPLQVSAPDAHTVVITFPTRFAPGLALLDNLPIYPKHQLQAALNAHTFAAAWGNTTPPGSIAGLGPFMLTEYTPGQRLIFSRNPRYWRKDASGAALPYLDRIDMEVVSSSDAEMLRMEAGTIDVMSQADAPAQEIATLRRLRDQGTLQLVDVGIGVDPNTLFFNLVPSSAVARAKPYLERTEFRQAVSYAVDRQAIASTVYLGAAVPIYGPVTPGNRIWYSDAAPTYPHDPARAKGLLAGLGLRDRNDDGMLEDAAGHPVRFSILTDNNNLRARVATMIQAQLKDVGVAVDVDARDPQSVFGRFGKGDYESIYYGFQASAMDPAMNLDLWLSSGSAHVWDPEQRTPATPWERRIDQLMQEQTGANSLADRQRLFADVQRIFGENLPELYFVAPKISVAMSRRVGGATPVLLDPKILWNPDTLYVTGPPPR